MAVTTTNYDQMIQKNFAAVMLTRMSVNIGGQLRHLGEMRSIENAESTTFNRATHGKAVTTAPQLYGGAKKNSTGGEYTSIECKPGYIYSYEKLEEVNFKVTSIDYNGYIPIKLDNELQLYEDDAIMKVVSSSTTLDKQGDATKELDDQIPALIQAAKFAKANAAMTPDKRQWTAMVMTQKTFSRLYANEKLINSNYVGEQAVNGSDLKPVFYGCEVIHYKNPDAATLPDDKIYFIPSNTIGCAEWKNSNKTEYQSSIMNEDTVAFAAKKSFNAVVIEPESIIEFSTKPAVVTP